MTSRNYSKYKVDDVSAVLVRCGARDYFPFIMTNSKVQLVGVPCGHHGGYSFYKGLRYTSECGKPKILALGEFVFLKIWQDEEIVSIGEPQLIWEDRGSGHTLVSLRLYFMPENTPDGRTEEHGEHEVICLSEKVVIRAEDLISLLRSAVDIKWQTGLKGVYGSQPGLVTPQPSFPNTLKSPTPKTNNNNSHNKSAADGVCYPDSKLPSSPTNNVTGSPNNTNDISTHHNNSISPPNTPQTIQIDSPNSQVKTEPEVKVEPGAMKSEVSSPPPSDRQYINHQQTAIKSEGDSKYTCAINSAIENCKGGSVNHAMPETMYYPPPVSGALDIREICREKKLIGDIIGPDTVHPIVLSYDRYCRMRCLIARLGTVEDNMRSTVVQALGGFLVPSRNTLLLFCRDVFEYPELEGHDLLCNHLAPKLQGRPRKKYKKRSLTNQLNSLHNNAAGNNNNSDSDSSEETNNEDNSNAYSSTVAAKPKLKGRPGLVVLPKPGLTATKPNSLRAMDRKAKPVGAGLGGLGGLQHGYSLARNACQTGSASSNSGFGGRGAAGVNTLRGGPHHHHHLTATTSKSGYLQHHHHHLTSSSSSSLINTSASIMGSVSSPTITSSTSSLAGGGKLCKTSNGGNQGGSGFLNAMQQPDFSTPALNRLIEVDFMSKLHKFMRDRNTPITRLPHIGYRQLNVFELFSKVQQLGGYEAVCAKKQWKLLYDQLAGPHHQLQPSAPSPTPPASAANVMRKHYERLLYPYEKFLLNEQKRLYGSETAKQIQQQHQQQLQNARNNNKKQQMQQQQHNDNEPSVSILQGVPCSTSTTTITTSTPPPPTSHHPPGLSGGTGAGAGLPSLQQQQQLLQPPLTAHLTVPKVSSGGGKKEPSIPADLAKRPEITITPIPRSLNDTLAVAAAAASSSNPLSGLLGPGFPGNLNLKALGLDIPELNLLDLNTLSNLAELAKKYDKNNPFLAMAAAAAASMSSGGGGLTCEPAAKRFKADDVGRMNGARDNGGAGTNRFQDRGPRPHPLDLQAAASELSKLHSVPDLVSADLLRSMNMLDANSKLLLPAHQSTKTITALAALLPQTSIFPAPAPAAHQQNTMRSPMKSSQGDSPRAEPPRVFQSQNLYAQSSRVYDKPTADHHHQHHHHPLHHHQGGPSSSSPKDNYHHLLHHSSQSSLSLSSHHNTSSGRENSGVGCGSNNNNNSKSSSPEIQILDLSRPPSCLGSGSNSSGGKNGKSVNKSSDRLDVELLDLSTRRDITVSAVPKPSLGNKHSRSSHLPPQVSLKSAVEGITITPNHNNTSNNNSSNCNTSNSRNYRSGGGGNNNSGLGSLTSAELSNLMSGMPNAALMAAAAAAAQGMPQGLPPGLLGLGSVGSPGGGGSIPASLLPFLMGTAGVSNSVSASTSKASISLVQSFHNSPSSSSSSPVTSVSSNSGAGLSMFPYLDPNSLAAYYNTLMPHSLLQPPPNTSTANSLSNASLAAAQQAVQMAHLSSLGLAGLPSNLAASLSNLGGNAGVSPETLGMYKNFLGAAAASSGGGGGGSNNMMPPPHFLAALMSPGSKPNKK